MSRWFNCSLRSEKMSLIQLYIPLEVTRQTLYELGNQGLIDFCDLNSKSTAYWRPYVDELTSLNELEQKLEYLWGKIKSANLFTSISENKNPNPDTNKFFYKQQKLEVLKSFIDEVHSRVKSMDESLKDLAKNYTDTILKMHILREVKTYLDKDAVKEFSTDKTSMSMQEEQMECGEAQSAGPRYVFVAGVVPRRILPVFEQVIFRLLRGNSFMQFSDMPDVVNPIGERLTNMIVFAIFIHGKEVLKKVTRVCPIMCHTTMMVDNCHDEIERQANECESKCEDLNKIMVNIKNTLTIELTSLSEDIENWSTVITNEKAVSSTMSMFNLDKMASRKNLIAEGWCPTEALDTIRDALKNVGAKSGSTMCPFMSVIDSTNCKPPTYLKRSYLTSCAQDIINSYSIPAYGEINPGLYTVITFPFLFSIMFGDLGHGFVLVLFAVYMIFNKKFDPKKSGEIMAMMYNARYMILLMGLFAMYTGLIYSDIVSLPIKLFPSGWVLNSDGSKYIHRADYPFGIDGAWHASKNFIMYLNPYKMKLSIILGVTQMLFGITLNGINNFYLNQKIRIITELIPQLMFFVSIFGYMTILIIAKWLMKFPDPSKAPSILNIMIRMFMSPFSLPSDDYLYRGQGIVQPALLILALLCVPWMLLAHPLYEKYVEKKYEKEASNRGTQKVEERGMNGYSSLNSEDPALENNEVSIKVGDYSEKEAPRSLSNDEGESNEEEITFGSDMIQQAIHTTEFCLNSMSNTASYLRLWALSLAHSELSKINWNMVIASALSAKNIGLRTGALIVAFPLWAILTIGILILMEGLSAFLHTLRLHWIEFQSKFYIGEGTEFQPFSFERIMKQKLAEQQ